jgi:transposase
MHVVPVKSLAVQAAGMVLTVRETLVRQRTQLINTIRGHAAEYGVIAAKGTAHIGALLERIALDPAVPPVAQAMFVVLGRQLDTLREEVAALDRTLAAQHKADPVSQRLAKVPGIGPLGALSLALTVDATQFRSGRHFAAWLGLTPKQNSTGGKPRLGGISRQGNERLRQLLVLGATAVIRQARPGSRLASAWLMGLLQRRPKKLVAVALANKMARVVWAMMTRGEAYRPPLAAA